MKTSKIELLQCRDLPILCFIDKVYIRLDALNHFFKMPQAFLDNWVETHIKRENTLYIKMVYWIDLEMFDDSTENSMVMPYKTELFNLYFGKSSPKKNSNSNLSLIYETMKIRVNHYDYLLDTLRMDPTIGTAQNIAISISLFSYLTSLRTISNRARFYLFYRFFDENLEFKPSFCTSSYTSFLNKLRAFKQRGIGVFFHRNAGNKNAGKSFSEDDQAKLKALYSDGIKISFRQITREINMFRKVDRGEKTVSIQTVIRHLKKREDYSNMYFQRYGAEAIFNFMMHPLRDQPRNPGTVYQIDGSRFNIIYRNNDGAVGFKQIIVLLDVFSKKIVGYTLANSETFLAYYEVIISALKKTGFLPHEIICDNLSGLKSRESIDFKNKLTKLGVIFKPHMVGNPQAKGHVENWFSLFGMNYLKKVYGYFGDGLKSRLKDGKAKPELLLKYRNNKNIRNEQELNEIIQEQITLYNKTYNYKNSFPEDLFRETSTAHVIHINDDLMKYLVFKETEKKINKAGIRLQVKGKIYEYPIFKNNIDLLEKYLHKSILIRYDPDHLDQVYIYPDRNSIQYTHAIKLHRNFPLANAEQTEDDIKNLKIFTSKRNSLKSHLTKISRENEIIPIHSILGSLDSKEQVQVSINNYLLDEEDEMDHIDYKSLLLERGTNNLIK